MNSPKPSFKHLRELLPQSAKDTQRLEWLLNSALTPTVTVIGKYNHGKSRLLNELIDEAHFKTADKRETIALSAYLKNGVRWLDAPGLDSDVSHEDDDLAAHAAWREADVRLFVHSAKEGELDAREVTALKEFMADSKDSGRKLLCVLSQIDQVSENDLTRVVDEISKQVPSLLLHCTSSTRYRKGIDEDKKLLRKKSGFDEFRAHLDAALAGVISARHAEIEAISLRLQTALANISKENAKVISDLRNKRISMRQKFTRGIEELLDSAQQNLKET